MNYQTHRPHRDLESLVKFYWTLEVPFEPKKQKQKIVPDGCIEMTFNLGDKIKRYISEDDFILNPNAMVMGQRTKSYYILPAGDVDTIAICGRITKLFPETLSAKLLRDFSFRHNRLSHSLPCWRHSK